MKIYLHLSRENIEVKLATGRLISILLSIGLGPTTKRRTQVQVLDIVKGGKPQRHITSHVGTLRAKDGLPHPRGAINTKIKLGSAHSCNNLLGLLKVLLRTPVERVADLVRLNIDPDTTNVQLVVFDGLDEVANLGFVCLALVARARAGEEVGVKVLVAGGYGVLVAGDEGWVDAAALGAGLLVATEDGAGEALAEGLFVGGGVDFDGGVDGMGEGAGGANEAEEDG